MHESTRTLPIKIKLEDIKHDNIKELIEKTTAIEQQHQETLEIIPTLAISIIILHIYISRISSRLIQALVEEKTILAAAC